MGLPMARNLVQAGFEVRGYARRVEVAKQAGDVGVEVRTTLPDLARDAEVLVTMVTTSEDVLEVATGDTGLYAAAAAGAVHIDMSTIDPDVSRRLAGLAAERGLDFLDAPVSGGSTGAEEGTLTVMVGGDAEVLERCRPVFDAVGQPERVFHCGPVGSGEVVKLCNNLLVGAISAATLEALAVGVRAGVSLETLVEVISVSSGGGPQLSGQLAQRGLRGQFDPGFTTALLLKDLRLVRELAHRSGEATPFLDQAISRFEASASAGNSALDYTALVTVLEREIGKRLRVG
jgi:3-hydroxyisobutyrate dehydrogenase-like beta-hydroxyacid dehydrogenase